MSTARLFFIPCLPGYYYYRTRCLRGVERVAHVLKFWCPYVLLLHLLGMAYGRADVTVVLAWLLFMNAYDVICWENDEWSTRREPRPTLREWDGGVSCRVFLVAKLVWTLVLLVAIGVWGMGLLPACVVLAITAMLGGLHNRLPAIARPVTHYVLYLAKGAMLLAPFWGTIPRSAWLRYTAYTALFSVTYAPRYFVKKVLRPGHDGGSGGEKGKWLNLVLQPIVLKNLAIGGLAAWDARFIWILLWIDAVTLIEFLLGRRIPQIHEG